MLIDNPSLPMAKPRGTIKRFGPMGNAATAKKIMVRDALSYAPISDASPHSRGAMRPSRAKIDRPER
jgi:hypothetical protein